MQAHLNDPIKPPTLYESHRFLTVATFLLLFSPLLISFLFWLFSGPNVHYEVSLAEWLSPITRPIVSLLAQPDIQSAEGLIVRRDVISASGRVALDNLVLALNLALLLPQICLAAYTILSFRGVISKSIQFRYGMTPAEKLKPLLPHMLTFFAMGGLGLTLLFYSNFGFALLEVSGYHFNEFWQFLGLTGAYFTMVNAGIVFGFYLAVMRISRR